MNTTKLIICTLVSFVFIFLTEYLWYGMLGNGGGSEDMWPIWHWMIIGYLLFSLVFCYMYPKGVEGGAASQEGLKYGILIALLVQVSAGLGWLALPELLVESAQPTIGGFVKNSAFHIVQMGILGVVVAYLSGVHSGPDGVRGGTGSSGHTGGRDAPPPPPTGAEGGN